MVKVILELASNGVIKTVTDDNINGAGDKLETKTVYDFDNDKNYQRRIEFLYELCEELGIDTGNKFDKHTLSMKVEWGRNYMPESDEVDNKIKQLSVDLKELKSLKKDIDELNEKV